MRRKRAALASEPPFARPASAGLGFIISQATQFLRNDMIFVALGVYCLLGLLTDALVRLLERRALGWRRGLLEA